MSTKLGELLIEGGVITREDLDRALLVQRSVGGRLGLHLVRLGIVPEDQLAGFLARQLNVPMVGPDALADIPEDVIARFPRNMAEQHRTVPFAWDGQALSVCLADPQNLDRIDELAFALDCDLRPHLVTEMVLDEALERYYAVAADTWDTATTAGRAPVSDMPPDDDPDGGFAPNQAPTTWTPSAAIPMADEAPPAAAAPKRPPPPLPARKPPPPVPDSPPTPAPTHTPGTAADAFEKLAGAQTHDDVVEALFAFFGKLFGHVCIVRIDGNTAIAAYAGPSDGGHPVEPPVETSLAEAPTLKEVLARPQMSHRDEVSDSGLARLFDVAGMPATSISILPVFDYGKPAYVVLGQGRSPPQLRRVANVIKLFLTAVSHALRMVKLRDDIRTEGTR
jgi:hypothetical protein